MAADENQPPGSSGSRSAASRESRNSVSDATAGMVTQYPNTIIIIVYLHDVILLIYQVWRGCLWAGRGRGRGRSLARGGRGL